MTNLLLVPPIAFLICLLLVALLSLLGKRMAGPSKYSALKSSIYSSGEAHRQTGGAPGYQPFFLIALFFAILHLGVLMVGTGSLSWMSVAYMGGLFFVLVALILG